MTPRRPSRWTKLRDARRSASEKAGEKVLRGPDAAVERAEASHPYEVSYVAKAAIICKRNAEEGMAEQACVAFEAEHGAQDVKAGGGQ